MKCKKCNVDLIKESKFCNSCGNKIEEKEPSLSEMFNKSVKSAELLWFTIGLIKGNCSKDKKQKKWFKETFEKDLLKNPNLAEHYKWINAEFNKNYPQKRN